MNCPFCGYNNADDATTCFACGGPLQPGTDKNIPTAEPDFAAMGLESPAAEPENPAPETQPAPPAPAPEEAGPSFPVQEFPPLSAAAPGNRNNTLKWVLIAVAVVVLLCACAACAAALMFQVRTR